MDPSWVCWFLFTPLGFSSAEVQPLPPHPAAVSAAPEDRFGRAGRRPVRRSSGARKMGTCLLRKRWAEQAKLVILMGTT